MKDPFTGSSLDAALFVWAEQHQLTPQRVSAMRTQILALEPITSQELPPSWWSEFSARFNACLHQSLGSVDLGSVGLSSTLIRRIPLHEFGWLHNQTPIR